MLYRTAVVALACMIGLRQSSSGQTEDLTIVSGPRLLLDGVNELNLKDDTGFQPVRFFAGRGTRQGNYDHWHETYLMSDGFTHLVNIGNTNDDGESGIRFWKGKHSNQWVVIVPSQPGYKLAIIRDGLLDAMVFDEQGRVIIGQLPPNDYGPPQARLHVRGMVDERQLVVEAAESQEDAVFQVTNWGGNQQHLVVTAGGNVGIGSDQPLGKLDVAGSITLRSTSPRSAQAIDREDQLDSIEQHTAKMKEGRRLPAMPRPKFDEQGREVVDLAAHQRAVVRELETAHHYIAELDRELRELRDKLESRK